jgi:hypothetical protein
MPEPRGRDSLATHGKLRTILPKSVMVTNEDGKNILRLNEGESYTDYELSKDNLLNLAVMALNLYWRVR